MKFVIDGVPLLMVKKRVALPATKLPLVSCAAVKDRVPACNSVATFPDMVAIDVLPEV